MANKVKKHAQSNFIPERLVLYNLKISKNEIENNKAKTIPDIVQNTDVYNSRKRDNVV